MILTLLISLVSYNLLSGGNKIGLKYLKFILFLYGFMILVFAVVAFSISGNTEADNI